MGRLLHVPIPLQKEYYAWNYGIGRVRRIETMRIDASDFRNAASILRENKTKLRGFEAL